jgi:hypothetical protein
MNMTNKEVYEQLESLKFDRQSFLNNTEDDAIYKEDIQALEIAMQKFKISKGMTVGEFIKLLENISDSVKILNFDKLVDIVYSKDLISGQERIYLQFEE